MLSRTVVVFLFGVAQAIILAAVLYTLVRYYLKKRSLEQDPGIRLDAPDFHASVKRAPLHNPMSQNMGTDPGQTQQKQQVKPAALTSALPTWDQSTPAHVVLEITPGADAEAIEAAYKKQLKKYHPDRFASWGKGYQTRAHHVILLLQKARDEMLKKR